MDDVRVPIKISQRGTDYWVMGSEGAQGYTVHIGFTVPQRDGGGFSVTATHHVYGWDSVQKVVGRKIKRDPEKWS